MRPSPKAALPTAPGKTEANKHVLAYLRWRAMDGEGGKSLRVSASGRVSDIIGQSNVLLEALGNAKTTNKCAANHKSQSTTLIPPAAERLAPLHPNPTPNPHPHPNPNPNPNLVPDPDPNPNPNPNHQ